MDPSPCFDGVAAVIRHAVAQQQARLLPAERAADGGNGEPGPPCWARGLL